MNNTSLFTYTLIIICTLFPFKILSNHAHHAHTIEIFNTLDSVQHYAQTLSEHPASDHGFFDIPEFKNLYHKRFSGFFKKLKHSYWQRAPFSSLLKAVVESRESTGRTGRFIESMLATPDLHLDVISDLDADFHSLIMFLQALRKENIIDNNFYIIDPTYYLIFNGNLTPLSAYAIDTLTLILRLIYNNPDRVICIRGMLEDKEQWKNYSLKEELIIRCTKKGDSLPYEDLINRFIDSLPLALYLHTSADKDLVRISSYGLAFEELKEKKVPDSFIKRTREIMQVSALEKSSSPNATKTKVLLRTPLAIDEQFPQNGLQFLGIFHETSIWSMASAPVGKLRVSHQFFERAFVKITTAPTINNWTIGLYNSRTNNKQLNLKKVYNLVNGQEIYSKEAGNAIIENLKKEISSLQKQIKKTQQTIKALEADSGDNLKN